MPCFIYLFLILDFLCCVSFLLCLSLCVSPSSCLLCLTPPSRPQVHSCTLGRLLQSLHCHGLSLDKLPRLKKQVHLHLQTEHKFFNHLSNVNMHRMSGEWLTLCRQRLWPLSRVLEIMNIPTDSCDVLQQGHLGLYSPHAHASVGV